MAKPILRHLTIWVVLFLMILRVAKEKHCINYEQENRY